MNRMRKLIALILHAMTSGVVGEAKALDRDDLAALQVAVHDLCVEPDQKGKYLKIEGDLNAGAALKIAGVDANANVTKEEWDGINQQLSYKMDPRDCAVKMMAILAPLFQQRQGVNQANGPRFKAVDISICNQALDSINVAVAGYDVSANAMMQKGWKVITYGGCAKFTEFSKGMFYYYAEGQDAYGYLHWGGGFSLCVDPSNRFEEINTPRNCVPPYVVRYFSTMFVGDNGTTITLTLPVH